MFGRLPKRLRHTLFPALWTSLLLFGAGFGFDGELRYLFPFIIPISILIGFFKSRILFFILIPTILIPTLLVNFYDSMSHFRHFNRMDKLDYEFSKSIIKDKFTGSGIRKFYPFGWKYIIEIYSENKDYFLEARVKTWENNWKEKLEQAIKVWGEAYICQLDGKFYKRVREPNDMPE